MKPIGVFALAAALVLSSAVTLSALDSKTGTSGTTDWGTRPNPDQERNNNGWSGGNRQADQVKSDSKDNRRSDDPEAAVNQPLMATGVDLNGPPMQFPADKTPE